MFTTQASKKGQLEIEDDLHILTENQRMIIKRQLIKAICVVQFLSNCAFVQMSPFFPIQAQDKGVSQINVGLIFGVMAVCQILASMLVGTFIHLFEVERYQLILIGSLLIIIQNGLLGSLWFVENTNLFIGLSFLAQCLGGIGAGTNSTATTAIMSSFKNDDRE